MLFDLRSRRRRRVVKGVYVFLALLIGVGLVGFGVGTGGNFGGLFSAAGNGGGSATGTVAAQKALNKAKRQAAAHPHQAAAWAAVAHAAYTLSQAYYVTSQGYTKDGFPVLAELQSAWNRYLAALPARPDTTLASEVASAFGVAPSGIEKYATAESAQELVAEASPTYSEYADLAYYAYYAHEYARGDLAAARAVALAPKNLKAQVRPARAGDSAEAHGKTGAPTAAGATSSGGATSSTGTTSSTSSSSTTSSSRSS